MSNDCDERIDALRQQCQRETAALRRRVRVLESEVAKLLAKNEISSEDSESSSEDDSWVYGPNWLEKTS